MSVSTIGQVEPVPLADVLGERDDRCVTEIASFLSGLGLVALVLFVLKAWEEYKRRENSARR
jgi:hypothetical protein